METVACNPMNKAIALLFFSTFPALLSAQISNVIIEPAFYHETALGTNDIIPAGSVTYRVYAEFLSEADFLSSVFGYDECHLLLTSTEPFFQSSAGGPTVESINPVVFNLFPELQYDSFVTIGKMTASDPGGAVYALEDPNAPWISSFEAGQDLVINTAIGGLWFVFNDGSNVNATAGSDLRVLIAQITTTGVLSGQIQAQVFVNGDAGNAIISECLTLAYSDEPGCTDATACNFNPIATVDDGSCEYPDDFFDCEGNCLNDADGDGVCDELEVPGCTDVTACNYNADATDEDGSCVSGPEVSVVVVNESCPDQEDGAASLLITNAVGDANVLWNTGSQEAIITGLSPGIYSYTVVDDSGCETTGSTAVEAASPFEVIAELQQPTCQTPSEGSIALQSAEGSTLSYNWTGLADQQAASTVVNLEEGSYEVVVSNSNGCEQILTYNLVLEDGDCLTIPTGFTPNSDGFNDVWEIVGWEAYPEITVTVFNRWGQELFRSRGYENPWNGLFEGIQLPMASYYYVIVLTPGESPLTGYVTLKY